MTRTKKYRYRESWGGGVTKRSLDALNKHIAKVGDVVSVRGYQYEDGKKVKQIAVIISGTLGSMRLGGFSWGYDGEGCRGMRALFAKLNVPQGEIDRVLNIKWPGWTGTPREFWRVTI